MFCTLGYKPFSILIHLSKSMFTITCSYHVFSFNLSIQTQYPYAHFVIIPQYAVICNKTVGAFHCIAFRLLLEYVIMHLARPILEITDSKLMSVFCTS